MRKMKDVLIVDDDRAIRDLICNALENEKLSCDSAADGLDALEKLKTSAYMVVLLDLKMPNLDGVGVLTTVREWEQFQNSGAVVLVMTAFPDRQELPVLGDVVQGIIRKPFDVAELAEIVRGCVNVRRRYAPQPTA